ncbi:MAG TPA: hypothetical protein VN033_14180 [Vulgatibacter sp.]|nr:hypothetical protein [Vulgatibacter sp.]
MARTSLLAGRVARAIAFFATFATALILASPASARERAPGTGGTVPPLGVLPWSSFTTGEPGTWVEYATLVGGHPVPPYLRVILLGDGAAGGEGGAWIEIWLSQRPGSAGQAFRVLVGTSPGREGAILAARARLLGGKVQEIAPDAWAAHAGGDGASVPGRPQLLPEVVSVLTPAGSFPSRMARAGEAKLWISSAVPGLGLVRLELPARAGLELHAIGTGGRGIVEEPVPRGASGSTGSTGAAGKDGDADPVGSSRGGSSAPASLPERNAPGASSPPSGLGPKGR